MPELYENNFSKAKYVFPVLVGPRIARNVHQLNTFKLSSI